MLARDQRLSTLEDQLRSQESKLVSQQNCSQEDITARDEVSFCSTVQCCFSNTCLVQTIQRLSEVIVDLQTKQSIFEESVSEMQSCAQEKADSLEVVISQLRNNNSMVLEELNEARARYDQVCGLLRSSIIFDSFMQLSSLAGSKQEQYLRAASDKAVKKAEAQVERLRGTIHKMEEAASLSRNELIELRSQRAAADRSIKGFERQLASKEKVSVRCLNSFFHFSYSGSHYGSNNLLEFCISAKRDEISTVRGRIRQC